MWYWLTRRRSACSLEDNSKMNIKELRCEGVQWIQMAQRWAVVSTAGNAERLLAPPDYLTWNYTRVTSRETNWRQLWSDIVLLLLCRFTKFHVSIAIKIHFGGEEVLTPCRLAGGHQHLIGTFFPPMALWPVIWYLPPLHRGFTITI